MDTFNANYKKAYRIIRNVLLENYHNGVNNEIPLTTFKRSHFSERRAQSSLIIYKFSILIKMINMARTILLSDR